MWLRNINLISKVSLYFLAVTLVFSGCSVRSQGKWELVRYENLPHAAGLGPIVFDDKNEGWALTWAELFRVRDQGKTWIPVLKNEGRRAFYSFTFLTSTTGVVVGTQEKGAAYTVLILQTSDGGVSWQERPTNVIAEPDRDRRPVLQSVAFCGEKNGWAVGGDLILHTSDGGLTWATQHGDASGENLFTVACSSSDRAWAAGTGGLLLATSNGGNTWGRQETGSKEILMQVRFFGEIGWIVGGTNGKSVLLRTNDGGQNWGPQQLDVKAGLFDIFFLGSNGWIAGEKGTLLETSDGGRTWLRQTVPTTENLTSLFFLSAKHGWVGGDRMTLLRYSE